MKNILTRVRSYERGLRFRHGDFRGLLGPGAYRFWSRLWSGERDRVDVVSTLAVRFEHALLDVLVADARLREELVVADLKDHERAVVFQAGRAAWILGPGRHAFWKAPFRIEVETFDVAASVRFEHPKLDAILRLPEASKWLRSVDVGPSEEVVLFVNGRPAGRLAKGRHAFWTGAAGVDWKAVDQREQVADVQGQEILTRDKVTLRLNLTVSWSVSDVEAALLAVADHAQALYREAQLALRAAVGSRTLDAILSDKEAVGAEVRDALVARVAAFGVAVRSVGLKDIILPGEMKAILNQVITAEKEAEANLIRRREETAAARSQANTARLLAENPVLARMKELEALQAILAGTKATFVFGHGPLADQVRGLVTADGGKEG